MKTAKIYTKELKRHIQKIATWMPDEHLEIGQIGVMKNYGFIPKSHLDKKSIPFSIKKDPTASDIDYQTQGAVSISPLLSGNVPVAGQVPTTVKASVKINFSQKNAVVFKAKNVYHHYIDNLEEVEKAILQRYSEDSWEKDWVVITGLSVADSATIIISGAQNSEIALKAGADIAVAHIDIADASLGLQIAKDQNINVKHIAKQGLTPLFRAHKVKTPLFGKPKVDVRKRFPDSLNVSEKDKGVFEEIELDDLY